MIVTVDDWYIGHLLKTFFSFYSSRLQKKKSNFYILQVYKSSLPLFVCVEIPYVRWLVMSRGKVVFFFFFYQNIFPFFFLSVAKPLAGHTLIGPHVCTREPLNSREPWAYAALSGKSSPSVRIAVTELLSEIDLKIQNLRWSYSLCWALLWPSLQPLPSIKTTKLRYNVDFVWIMFRIWAFIWFVSSFFFHCSFLQISCLVVVVTHSGIDCGVNAR